MKFSYEGRVYEYQQDKMPLADAVAIKAHTGMGVRSYMDGIKDFDPDAFTAMVFLALRRAGEVPRWEDIDFDVMELMESFEGDAEAPPPGPAAGKTQWPEDEPTSVPSPSSDSSPPPLTS